MFYLNSWISQYFLLFFINNRIIFSIFFFRKITWVYTNAACNMVLKDILTNIKCCKAPLVPSYTLYGLTIILEWPSRVQIIYMDLVTLLPWILDLFLISHQGWLIICAKRIMCSIWHPVIWILHYLKPIQVSIQNVSVSV